MKCSRFDALLEAMHISSVRRKVIKETTEPDLIRWNFRYLASSNKDEEKMEEEEQGKKIVMIPPLLYCQRNKTETKKIKSKRRVCNLVTHEKYIRYEVVLYFVRF